MFTILLLGPLSFILTLTLTLTPTRPKCSQPKFFIKLKKWPKINVFTETAL